MASELADKIRSLSASARHTDNDGHISAAGQFLFRNMTEIADKLDRLEEAEALLKNIRETPMSHYEVDCLIDDFAGRKAND